MPVLNGTLQLKPFVVRNYSYFCFLTRSSSEISNYPWEPLSAVEASCIDAAFFSKIGVTTEIMATHSDRLIWTKLTYFGAALLA